MPANGVTDGPAHGGMSAGVRLAAFMNRRKTTVTKETVNLEMMELKVDRGFTQTKREYFAAMAMQGMLASDDFYAAPRNTGLLVQRAISIADAPAGSGQRIVR